MEQPPSCSTWSRVITNDHSRFIIASRSLSNTFKPIECEPHYCEPEEDSMSECERGLAHLRTAASQTSLSVPGGLHRADDSLFITSAISHGDIADLYNVPLDSDIYTLPVDTVPRHLPPRFTNLHRAKRRRRHTSACHEVIEKKKEERERQDWRWEVDEVVGRVAGLGGDGVEPPSEPVHMTLQEVRHFLHNLYSTAASHQPPRDKHHQRSSLPHLLKKALCSVFRLRVGSKRCQRRPVSGLVEPNKVIVLEAPRSLAARALPPLPATPPPVPTLSAHPPPPAHFADSLDRVKDCGWYWGPVSGEAAERILSNEPDGSFIVRDSSDDHYIFSLTFRLNGCIRHVRIEHDHGNFSFGSATKFKSQTIVDFIETAVEHSRSGRYLFFLHRRPVLGPMRVQLLHPVSRFKHIQSLQHLCRFVIVKTVRRDLIYKLPLPRRLIDYLNSPHYYSEQLGDHLSSAQRHSPVHLISFAPPPPPPLH